MDELEKIRKKKLAQLQRLQQERLQQQMQEEAQVQQQIEQLEMIVKHALTKEALQRYGNLKAAHPEKAMQLLVILAQAIQQGQINQVDDKTLKQILIRLTPEKKEFKIKRV
jgi:programmed cell death protein 5